MKYNYLAEVKISLPGGLQLDLVLSAGISLKSSLGSLRKNHLHLIFLAKSPKSLLRSALFINVGVGEKPIHFPKTLVFKSVNTL